MHCDPRPRILRALYSVFRPLARILLHHAIGCRDVYEAFKYAMVSVATENYGIRGRPTNVSRVAAMTGLTRKEVTRIRALMKSGRVDFHANTRSIDQVLHGWHSDNRYRNDDGSPKALPFVGTNASFTTLVRDYAGDLPAGAIRTELQRLGAIDVGKSGYITVRREFAALPTSPDALCEHLEIDVRSIVTCIASDAGPADSKDFNRRFGIVVRRLKERDLHGYATIAREKLAGVFDALEKLESALQDLPSDGNLSETGDPVVIGAYVCRNTEFQEYR